MNSKWLLVVVAGKKVSEGEFSANPTGLGRRRKRQKQRAGIYIGSNLEPAF